jgi:hypothetical protein
MILGGKRVQTQDAIKIVRKFQNLGFVRLKLTGDILKRLSLSGVVRDNAVSRD